MHRGFPKQVALDDGNGPALDAFAKSAIANGVHHALTTSALALSLIAAGLTLLPAESDARPRGRAGGFHAGAFHAGGLGAFTPESDPAGSAVARDGPAVGTTEEATTGEAGDIP